MDLVPGTGNLGVLRLLEAGGADELAAVADADPVTRINDALVKE